MASGRKKAIIIKKSIWHSFHFSPFSETKILPTFGKLSFRKNFKKPWVVGGDVERLKYTFMVVNHCTKYSATAFLEIVNREENKIYDWHCLL